MNKKPISQREAQRLRRRVRELEARLVNAQNMLRYSGEHIWKRVDVPVETLAALRTAQSLGFIVVARPDRNEPTVHYHAIPVRMARGILELADD